MRAKFGKRVSIYFEDDLKRVMDVEAAREGMTLSTLVRRAVREYCVPGSDERSMAMRAFVGARGGTDDSGDGVRELRCGNRMDRLNSE